MKEGRRARIKVVPVLNDKDSKERLQFCQNLLKKSDAKRHNNVAHSDEKYFELSACGTGTLVIHPDGSPLSKEKRVREVRCKQHPPKILVHATITRPKMLNPREVGRVGRVRAKFDSNLNGKIHLVRSFGGMQHHCMS